jgi:5'-nucleotidase
LTKQSVYSPAQSWQAVSTSRPSATHFMGMHQSLGFQLAQLGKDASAAVRRHYLVLQKFVTCSQKILNLIFCFHLQGAARRVNAQRKLVEVESVAAAGKQEVRVIKKLFRAEVIAFSVDFDLAKSHCCCCPNHLFDLCNY